MANYNKVILIGNLTRDPELRYTPKGVAIAKLGLAVKRSWRDANSSEMKEEVTFVDIDAFGKQAETIGQYMKKGRPIMIEGRLKLDTWEDKQTNQKRSKLGVVLESFQFLDYRGAEDGGGGMPRPRPSAPAGTGANPESAPADAEGSPADDDVPF
ncbi:MAG: single-stranded DNA-binding protein [Verrucomicrobiota bacterium]